MAVTEEAKAGGSVLVTKTIPEGRNWKKMIRIEAGKAAEQ